MNYEYIDIVFNNLGRVVYTSLPAAIKQYSNNYKLRVGLTTRNSDISVISASIKTIITLPQRILTPDINETIDANNVSIDNVFTYTFSQFDTKIFQDHMEITVNIKTIDETIFNHTVSIPMTKSNYGETTLKLVDDDGTLNSFVNGMYTGVIDITNRVNILEEVVDPNSSLNNPQILEGINNNINMLNSQLNILSNDFSTFKTSSNTKFHILDTYKLDVNKGGEIKAPITITNTDGDLIKLENGVISATSAHFSGDSDYMDQDDIGIRVNDLETQEEIAITPRKLKIWTRSGVSFDVEGQKLKPLAYSNSSVYTSAMFAGKAVLNMDTMLGGGRVDSANYKAAILTIKSANPSRLNTNGHAMYLFSTYYPSAAVGYISSLTPIVEEADTTKKVKMYLSDESGTAISNGKTPYVTATITDTNYNFCVSIIPIFW